MKNLLLTLIRWYKQTAPVRYETARNLSMPVHTCRFQPTCSEYMYDAVEKYGASKGFYLGLKRFLRCNPWNKGGYDPV